LGEQKDGIVGKDAKFRERRIMDAKDSQGRGGGTIRDRTEARSAVENKTIRKE